MALAVTEMPIYLSGAEGKVSLPRNAERTGGFVTQSVAIGATSTQSEAFAANTHVVRLIPDVACRVEFGSDPTALAGTSQLLQPNSQTWHVVTPGHMVAVITP